MNYYERHLGDYAKDTAHLTMLEHGAYGLLLDRYYGTEQGIPADQAHRVARARTREEKQAVDAVLSEFFTLRDGVWVNQRAEEEIEKAKVRIDAAKNNGKRGGRPKKKPAGSETETQQKPNGFPAGSETETQSKAHQAPYTNHQTPVGEQPVVVDQPLSATATLENATRAGALCKQLRALGIDAAPHMATLPEMLERFTDEQIFAVAEIAKAKKPGERINLNYLVPILNEPAKPAPAGRRAPAIENFDGREYGQGGRL